MATTVLSGGLAVYGQQPALAGGSVPDYNNNAAPSFFYDGACLLDPRFGVQEPQTWGYKMLGFFGTTHIPTLDFVPYTATATNVAASQTSVAGTPLTLVSTSATGVTVLSVATQILPSGNILPAGTVCLDTPQAILQFGTSKDIGIYDPNTMSSRCLVLTNNTNESATGTYLFKGWDCYGYPMTQLMTAPNATTGNTLKAFKYIGSITPAGAAIGSTATTVGTIDTIGFPLQTSFFGDNTINGAAATGTLVTAVTGYTAAVTTVPSTNLLGDVRGTYALQSASNNSIRIQVKQTVRPTLLAGGTTAAAVTGLFGQPQV